MNKLKSFKQFILNEGVKPVEEYFEQTVQYNTPKYKSRDITISMKIDDFLLLATKLSNPETDKLDNLNNLIQSNTKFESLPFLTTEIVEDNPLELQVTGHEGRHRALTLKQLGYSSIPVVIKEQNLRWSEQNDDNSFDYKKVFPIFLLSQDDNKKISFPLTRKEIK